MTRDVSLQRDKEEEMREDKCTKDKDLCHWACGGSKGGVMEAELAWNCLPSRITKAALFITCLS